MQKDKVVEYLVNWLKDYAQKSKLQGFVIGISGGVDSALSSTLCAQTGLPTLALEMPIHQGESQINRSQEHLKWLKQHFPQVKSQTIDLSATFDEMAHTLPSGKEQEKQLLGLANTRARLRMSCLYYFAGINGYLVCGTGNKIEDFGIGFYTKYGDGGVDLNPLADLTKTEVYILARHLEIKESILEARPTDGLFGDNRTDEEQIGASYSELEWAMDKAEKGKTEADFTGRKLEVFKNYLNRHRANRHKWEPIPVCKIPDALKK